MTDQLLFPTLPHGLTFLLLHPALQLCLQKSQLPPLPPSLHTKPAECSYEHQNYLLSSSFNFSETSFHNLCSFCAIDFTSFFYSEFPIFSTTPRTMNKWYSQVTHNSQIKNLWSLKTCMKVNPMTGIAT